MRLPDGVLATSAQRLRRRVLSERGPEWAAFVERLPRLVAELLEEWQLRAEDRTMHGHCALVVPVLQASGEAAVLKVGFPDEESEHEHLALTKWGGRGAVRLLRADPRRRALLLERLGEAGLEEAWDVEACETVGGLYGLLHVPAPPQLRSLSSYVAHVGDRLARLPRNAPVPHRLVEQAVSLIGDLAADPATDGTLLHTDLHYGNVLAADRGSWSAIDPKPLSGDPHYEPAPLLWNRYEELAGDVRNGVRRRFRAVIDAAGLDEDRARDWVVVRMLDLARQRLEEPPGVRRRLPTDQLLTRCVAIAKAVQD
ncbi:MAG: aminoglycoside phosphotransferase family protein [Marmoricola sp.]